MDENVDVTVDRGTVIVTRRDTAYGDRWRFTPSEARALHSKLGEVIERLPRTVCVGDLNGGEWFTYNGEEYLTLKARAYLGDVRAARVTDGALLPFSTGTKVTVPPKGDE